MEVGKLESIECRAGPFTRSARAGEYSGSGTTLSSWERARYSTCMRGNNQRWCAAPARAVKPWGQGQRGAGPVILRDTHILRLRVSCSPIDSVYSCHQETRLPCSGENSGV